MTTYKRHILKCWPKYFAAIACGDKMFEVRKNDRDFQVGDWVDLREWLPDEQKETGHFLTVEITYMFIGDAAVGLVLPEGLCVLGLRRV